MDASGTLMDRQSLGIGPDDARLAQSPFSLDIPIARPDPDWNEVAAGITVADANGSTTEAFSAPFPIFWPKQVLIDHAWGTKVLSAPNYEAGGIPPGIGIPHSLINSIPEGDYYAVVFFDAEGCPSVNYTINSFQAGAMWGYDVRGPNAPYAKARSTSGGGCMQKFHVDPSKEDGWLWGALSSTGTSNAIADESNIPAFAVCATAEVCDHVSLTLAPSASSTPPSRSISNVLFLPGIKGSKLYEDNPLCLFPSDSCGIPLWLPLADAAVPELFLDATGKSRRHVFVHENGVLGSALGRSFYDSFLQTLEDARSENTFGQGWGWKAAVYDWRLSLDDIVGNGAEHGTRVYFDEASSSPYLVQALHELASTSPTGKVTIVAHSNGGLVAKALMRSLGDTVATQLIDTIIFVGVPQSGAPRALGAILYGDSEGIPGLKNLPNFIMSTVHAREFGLNSPMAYHLLPSAAYLGAQQTEHPLVRFDGSDLLARERAAFGDTIDSPEELQNFAANDYGGRSMPAADDLTSANVLNANLLSYASVEHAALDPWQAPPGIQVYELGGYGVNTISGIDLYASPHKDGSQTLSYRPLFTPDGDGTVPVISALLMNAAQHVHHLWLDLPSMHTEAASYSHSNMLESADVQDAIRSILKGSSVYPSTVHAMDIASVPTQHQLAFYVHSPVALTVTDSQGRESGVSSDASTEGIPESTSGTLGEVKYVLVPADTTYTLTLTGEDTGSFTLDLQEQVGGATVASSTIADVPVTRSTSATLGIGGSLTRMTALTVDQDGDGSTDFAVQPVLGATVFPETGTDTPVRGHRSSIPQKLQTVAVSLLQAAPLPPSVAKRIIPVARHPIVLGNSLHAASTTKATSTLPREVRPTLFARIGTFLRKALHFVLAFVLKLTSLPAA